MMPFF